MRLGIVITSNDAETVWNAFRLGNFSAKKGDDVKIFLLGKGVEYESLDTETFRVRDQIEDFLSQRGKIYACGTCIAMRHAQAAELCHLSTLSDLYDIIKDCDKVISV